MIRGLQSLALSYPEENVDVVKDQSGTENQESKTKIHSKDQQLPQQKERKRSVEGSPSYLGLESPPLSVVVDTSLPDRLNDFCSVKQSHILQPEKHSTISNRPDINHKAAGPYIEPRRILGECADQLKDVFTDISNAYLHQVVVAKCLKSTTITLMIKKSSVSCHHYEMV